MGMLQNNGNYESIRNAQILENQARLASLGLHKTLLELRSKTQVREKRKVDRKIDYSCNPRRSSHRLKGISADIFTQPIERRVKRPFLRSSCGSSQWLSQEEFDRLCASQSRGSIHHPIYGIGCHNCGERKLCGEDDCKRCGDLDLDQPCIGKTDCSVCHSKKGMICRACLKVRYGEELEEVRENKQWMCPHCIEDKGIRPYWICNRYICLRKRNMAPIGNTAFKARGTGHKSVAQLVMDKLQQAAHLNNGRCDKNRIKRKGKFAKEVFQF